jgi:hypothetical protein
MEGMIPDKRPVIRLVEQAHEGKLCLPAFQRDFVWRRDEVADLVRSIMRGYFIGSLLLLRCDPQHAPFKPVFLTGAKPLLKEPQPELLVLDGQQRLTALLYALTAPDLKLKDSAQRRWFFLDLKLLLREPDNDEIVFDRTARELDGLGAANVQYSRHILPCDRLLKSKDFLSWRDGLDDWLREANPDEHKRFREEWRDSWTQAVNGFQSFEVPLVELPRVSDSESDALGRVCAIFEKLNSTGVELSVYDLLTARLYRSGIKLHDLWGEACKKHKHLNQWSKGKADTNKFGVLTIRTLALLRGLDPKPRFLINLSPENFEADWQGAAAAMERALEIVTNVGTDGFGVFNAKWLPGFGLLPVLAALRAQIETRKLGEGPRSDLRRWYWSNVFLERYSSAVESKSRKDYAELLAHWTEDQAEPAVFAEVRARLGSDGFSIRDSASQASAVYSGVFCLLAIRGARDWSRGESIQLQSLQDHHIFPRDYLKSHGLEKRVVVNSIVNRTLISDETNGKIKNKAPAIYLMSKEIFPSTARDGLLSPHFVEADATEAMSRATPTVLDVDLAVIYEDFCRARERAIVSEIRKACGVPETLKA